MKSLSLFTHPQVVYSPSTQKKIFWRMLITKQLMYPIDFHSIFLPTIEFNGVHQLSGYQHSSKYLPLCSAEERNSYRFETIWGWV